MTVAVLVGVTGLLSWSLLGSTPLDVLGAVIVLFLGVLYGIALRRLSVVGGFCTTVVCGYILLNRGFAYAGFHLGGLPVTVGELALAASLPMVIRDVATSSLKRDPLVLALGTWLLFGGIWLFLELPDANAEFAKSASLVYYPIFVLIGFSVASTLDQQDVVLRAVMITFFLHFAYIFGFPNDLAIQAASPRVLFDIGLFGHYNTGYVHIVGGAVFMILLADRYLSVGGTTAVALGSAYLATLMFVQARAGIVAMALCLPFIPLMGYTRRAGQLAGMVGIAVGIVLVAASLGVTVQGWKEPVSFDFLKHLALSIFGLDAGNFRDAGLLASRASRFMMWKISLEPNLDSFSAMFLGRGFGDPLVHMELATGWFKRSPHNSFVTVIARTGLAGLAIFASIHAIFVSRIFRHVVDRPRGTVDRAVIWGMLYYATFNVGAVFSVVYDTPYQAAPVYFLMGLMYRRVKLLEAVTHRSDINSV